MCFTLFLTQLIWLRLCLQVVNQWFWWWCIILSILIVLYLKVRDRWTTETFISLWTVYFMRTNSWTANSMIKDTLFKLFKLSVCQVMISHTDLVLHLYTMNELCAVIFLKSVIMTSFCLSFYSSEDFVV